ncbi:MAG TPA: site-specific integrase, partial [Anaerolineales bacterium]|nr:site-specific integrase [Anaerolineales bacterium]
MIEPAPYFEEFEAYLADTAHADLTIAGYLSDMRLFFAWYVPQYGTPPSFAVFTEMVVHAYKEAMAPLHPRTIYRRLAALAAFFHWARQAEYMRFPYNPVYPVKAERYAPPVIHWLTLPAQAQFLAVLERLTTCAMHL